MTRNKRTVVSENRCPVGRTLECFSLLPPIPRTPEEAGMTPEQMVTWGISRGQRLYWCSECTRLWCRREFNFLHVIGTQRTYGAHFVPNENMFDRIYVGN
jgi:hypothetical protein